MPMKFELHNRLVRELPRGRTPTGPSSLYGLASAGLHNLSLRGVPQSGATKQSSHRDRSHALRGVEVMDRHGALRAPRDDIWGLKTPPSVPSGKFVSYCMSLFTGDFGFALKDEVVHRL